MSHNEPSNQVAFISGPVEQPDNYFALHYEPQIREAIEEGRSFVLGPAPGTDTIALHYLVEHVDDPTSITVYLAKFQAEGTQAESLAYYKRLGVKIRVEGHTTGDRDAAMTRDSDYDILRYMSVEEQKTFFGERYYPRVSATEKNERRRMGLPLHVNYELRNPEGHRGGPSSSRQAPSASSSWTKRIKNWLMANVNRRSP